MSNVKEIVSISEKTIDRVKGILNWFNIPKEEARQHLIELVQKDSNLSYEQQVALIYNSRKYARECANSREIYEDAKKQFVEDVNESKIDDDWLHFFFSNAEKVSNKSMQAIWARLLAGEFNKPGSVSRKLMHIISIMDSDSARSFRTFCNYVFERRGMITANYNTEAVLIPTGFHADSFEFTLKVEKWLEDAKFADHRDLAINLTMNTGELNSLENLGLIQQVPDNSCGITLTYDIDGKTYFLVPKDDIGFPLGIYSFTTEGKQLYDIIGCVGCEAAFEIIRQYLLLRKVNFEIRILETKEKEDERFFS